MDNPKIGVIGYGYWGKNQARVLDELGVLQGVYDTDLKSSDDKYNFYPSFDQLLEDVDAVIICTPAESHFEIAKKALKKVDILVEKPLAIASKEVKKLIELETKYNKLILVGHQLHFHPAVVKMKKLMNDGEIGAVKWVYSNRLNMGKIRPYENVLWSFAPHDISLLLDFVNSEIKNISVQGTKIVNSNIEDTSLTLLEFKNKVKSHIFVSWIHPFKEQRFVVVGEKGSLVFSDTSVDKLKLYRTKISKLGIIDEHIFQNIELTNEEPLKQQAKYFIEVIKSRTAKTNNSLHALKVVSILEECNIKMKTLHE